MSSLPPGLSHLYNLQQHSAAAKHKKQKAANATRETGECSCTILQLWPGSSGAKSVQPLLLQ